MTSPGFEDRRRYQKLDRERLARHQLARLNQLLSRILPTNKFYAARLADLELPVRSLEQFSRIGFTTQHDLAAESTDGFAANRTNPLELYCRLHRTSGTRGRPLVVLDTADDWDWWISIWQYVLDEADVQAHDRVAMAFSFGPFIGFWSAHDAIAWRGAMLVPLGGMDTRSRLDLIRTSRATIIGCTPTYALRLAEVADEIGFDCRATSVSRIIVAGEPGGSMPAVRDRIETQWDARVVDHAGATEVGPWGFADSARRGLRVVESEFIAEFLSVENSQPVDEGQLAELVLTTLGRYGCPVLRYRTGDLVRPSRAASGFVLLEGGVLGRVDEMVIVRGVNIYPSSVEQILREFTDVAEYCMIAKKQGEMDMLEIQVEDRLHRPARIADELKVRLGLSVAVIEVPPGSLPRFEGKGQRFVDQR